MAKKNSITLKEIKKELTGVVEILSLTSNELQIVSVISSILLKMASMENEIKELKEEIANIPTRYDGGLM